MPASKPSKKDAAEERAYKVDTDAIALKVKQDFSTKDKARKATLQVVPKPVANAKKAA
jgi:ParB family chromosome partitioning protein